MVIFMADNKVNSKAGLFIPAGLFLGMGFGFLFSQIVAGIFLGLGLGFLLFGIFSIGRK